MLEHRLITVCAKEVALAILLDMTGQIMAMERFRVWLSETPLIETYTTTLYSMLLPGYA